MENRNKLYYGWIIVGTGLLISAVLIGTRQSYGIFFKSIEADFGLSRAETSGIYSAFMALCAVSAAFGGWALDKFGPRKTIAAMGFFTGLGFLISSQVHTAWQLYLTYSLITALGTGEAYTVVVGFVSRWFRKKRGLALGIASTGGGFGTFIYAPFAGYLIVSFDWRTAYVVMGIVALVAIIALSFLLKRSPEEIGLLPDGEKEAVKEDDAGAHLATEGVRFTVTAALKTPQFWVLFLIWAFAGTAVYIITTHIVPHATDLGFTEVIAATIVSVMSVFNIIGGLSVGALSDVFGRKAVSIGSALIGAGSFFLLMWMPNDIWLLYIAAALFGIPFGSMGTMVAALVVDIFGTHRIGGIMGIIGTAWFVGAAIGPMVGGILFDMYKSYFLAFLAAALCMLVVVLLLALLSKPRERVVTELAEGKK